MISDPHQQHFEPTMVELARRDIDSLKTVLESLLEFMLGIARVIDFEGADDAVQEAQVILLTKFPQFRGSTDAELRGWVRTIVCNLCFARLKEKRQGQPLGELDPAAPANRPSQDLRAVEERRKLVELLAKLSEDERTAVFLRHCEGWSVEQIAGVLNRTSSAVGGLLRRAMKKLRSRTTLSEWSQLLNLP